MRPFAADEHLFAVLADVQRADGLAHAPFADHLAGHLGGALDVVARAGGDVVEHHFFGHAAAQQQHQVVQQVAARIAMAVAFRQLHGHAQGAAARDDGHLVHGVRAGQQLGGKGVARLVVGGDALFLVAQDEAAALLAHQHLVLGVLEVAHVHGVLAHLGGLQGGLVDQVLQVRAREAGRALGDDVQFHAGGQGRAAGVHFKDALAAAHVGGGHHHLAVEAAGTQQGRVQHVGAVGGGDEDDALVGLEAVHFHQQLVQGLFALVVAAAKASATLAAHGVDFVDEDETGRVLLALHEQVAHARCAHAHEHFHEVGTGNGEERHARLAGNRTGKQGLAGAGRADQQHALGNAPAKAGELARVGQEFHHFAQLFLGLVHARHVLEGDAGRFRRDHAGARTPEGHGLSAAALHLAHEEYPHADQQQHGEPGNQQGHVPWGFLLRFRLHLDLLGDEARNQLGIMRGVGLERLALGGFAHQFLALDGHAQHLAAFDLLQEFRIGKTRLRPLRLIEQVEQDDHEQRDDRPENQIARKLVQVWPPCGSERPSCGRFFFLSRRELFDNARVRTFPGFSDKRIVRHAPRRALADVPCGFTRVAPLPPPAARTRRMRHARH